MDELNQQFRNFMFAGITIHFWDNITFCNNSAASSSCSETQKCSPISCVPTATEQSDPNSTSVVLYNEYGGWTCKARYSVDGSPGEKRPTKCGAVAAGPSCCRLRNATISIIATVPPAVRTATAVIAVPMVANVEVFFLHRSSMVGGTQHEATDDACNCSAGYHTLVVSAGELTCCNGHDCGVGGTYYEWLHRGPLVSFPVVATKGAC